MKEMNMDEFINIIIIAITCPLLLPIVIDETKLEREDGE